MKGRYFSLLVVCVLELSILQQQAQAQKSKRLKENFVLVPGENGAKARPRRCGSNGTVGKYCGQGKVCTARDKGRTGGDCKVNELLEVEKDRFCGDTNTIGKTCSKGGICVKYRDNTVSCVGQKAQVKEKSGVTAGPSYYADNTIDCKRIPGVCKEKKSALLLGGFLDNGPETYPCNLNVASISTNLVLTGSLEGLGAAVLNGDIYYCGGIRREREFSRDCFRPFSTGKGEYLTNTMAVGRAHFTMNTVGEKIIIVGGRNASGAIAEMEAFDGNISSILPHKLDPARMEHCAVAVREHVLFLFGGDATASVRVDKYDLEDGFEKFPDMPTPRRLHACVMYNGEVVVSGGNDGVTSVEAFNPWTQVWRTLPPMNKPRTGHTMEVVNGELIVFGGFPHTESAGTLEIFDGTKWTEKPMKKTHSLFASVSFTCK